MRAFVSEHGTEQRGTAAAALGPGVRCWAVSLAGPRSPLKLLVYEESTAEASARLHCDACRVTGWAHHPVTVASYHFVLQADAALEEGACAACAAQLPPDSPDACPACNASRHAPPHVFDVTRHRLHGVLHAHGYGA